jgi:hypothetical protein
MTLSVIFKALGTLLREDFMINLNQKSRVTVPFKWAFNCSIVSVMQRIKNH